MLATIFGAAAAVLAITLVALNVMLPLATVSFVISAAGVSSLTVAKAIKYVVHGQ